MRPIALRRVAIRGLMLLALLAAPAVRAQAPEPPDASSSTAPSPGPEVAPSAPGPGALHLSGPIDPQQYRLGPGDQLLLLFSGRVSRASLLEVDPQGGLTAPGLPVVPAAGRTLADVRRDVLKRLEEQIRGVVVDLRLARPRTFQVYLAGQVKNPGPVPVQGGSRVADVLVSDALLPKASHRRIEVVGRDGSRRNADLVRFYGAGDGAFNPLLADGDILFVPSELEQVYAYGALARAGRFELGAADSVRTLVAIAGGLLPSAAPDRALLVKWTSSQKADSIWLDLGQVASGATNPPLGNGDHLYVYYQPQFRQQHEATLMGEFERPGTFPIHEGRTHLSDLVREAGGFTPLADQSSIRIHRRGAASTDRDPELERLLRLSRNELTASEYEAMRTKLSGKREDYLVSWALLQKDPEALDVLMRDGDEVDVERLVRSIRIDGEVRQPGILTFSPGETVDDYVRRAGGYTSRAWRSKTRLTRAVTGQTLLARNVHSLDAGDFIWVPERPDRTIWEQSKDVLGVLTSVATVIIAIRTLK